MPLELAWTVACDIGRRMTASSRGWATEVGRLRPTTCCCRIGFERKRNSNSGADHTRRHARKANRVESRAACFVSGEIYVCPHSRRVTALSRSEQGGNAVKCENYKTNCRISCRDLRMTIPKGRDLSPISPECAHVAAGIPRRQKYVWARLLLLGEGNRSRQRAARAELFDAGARLGRP